MDKKQYRISTPGTTFRQTIYITFLLPGVGLGGQSGFRLDKQEAKVAANFTAFCRDFGVPGGCFGVPGWGSPGSTTPRV